MFEHLGNIPSNILKVVAPDNCRHQHCVPEVPISNHSRHRLPPPNLKRLTTWNNSYAAHQDLVYKLHFLNVAWTVFLQRGQATQFDCFVDLVFLQFWHLAFLTHESIVFLGVLLGFYILSFYLSSSVPLFLVHVKEMFEGLP